MTGSRAEAAPVRWGILGAAAIALHKVIPAMRQGRRAEIAAIASRDLVKARAAADALGIPRAYGSYEELLQDPAIEAVYNPLPNHLHVPWSIRAAEAGKHVLKKGIETIELPLVNQYTIQRDLFSEAIRRGTALPVPLEDSIANMAVMDAIFRSARSGQWELPAASD